MWIRLYGVVKAISLLLLLASKYGITKIIRQHEVMLESDWSEDGCQFRLHHEITC